MNKFNLKLQTQYRLYQHYPKWKYLGINLLNCTQELLEKNYKTDENTEEKLNKWRYVSCLGRMTQYCQMSVLPNLILGFMQ